MSATVADIYYVTVVSIPGTSNYWPHALSSWVNKLSLLRAVFSEVWDLQSFQA